MPRITKDPDERKNEIIDVAERLFLSKGFEETTISEIVRTIGVAQGLFYYYFKSKDEVIDAIATRYTEIMLKTFELITTDGTLDALGKFCKIFREMLAVCKNDLINRYHQEAYETMHQRLTAKMMDRFIPLIALIIREGITEGLFKLEEPDETAEILSFGIECYLNRIIRAYWGKPEFDEKVMRALCVLERALGVPKGGLQFR